MGQKNRHSNYSFESEIDSRDNNNPNFDLDEYIRQKSQSDTSSQLHQPDIEDREHSKFKNAVLIFLVFAAGFLWVNEWSVSETWNSVFGSDESATSFEFAPPVIPDFEIPDIPAPPISVNETGFVNYLLELNEAGLDDIFSSPAQQAFYQTDVPISYLSELVEARYQDLSYPAIIAYYNSDVPLEYLNTLRNAGYLEELSYPAIIALNSSGVSLDYLNTLDEAGYLQSLSYPAIIAYFNTGVTVDFLNRLRDNNLLENMSYPEVISAFNTDN